VRPSKRLAGRLMIDRCSISNALALHQERITPATEPSLHAMCVAIALAALLLVVGQRAVMPARAQAPNPPDAAAALEVSLAASTDSATVGQPISFTYAATPLDAAHAPSTLTLDFGDGENATIPPAASGSTSGSISHTYAGTQTYTVTFTAAAADGTSAGTSLMLPAVDPGPAGLPPGDQPATGIAGLPITFAATGSTLNSCGTIETYQIDFGDGTPAVNGQEATHTYTDSGTYTVMLTVTDCAGATATSTSSVIISPAGAPASQENRDLTHLTLTRGTLVPGRSSPSATSPAPAVYHPRGSPVSIRKQGSPYNTG
jgi:PKD repeat protein